MPLIKMKELFTKEDYGKAEKVLSKAKYENRIKLVGRATFSYDKPQINMRIVVDEESIPKYVQELMGDSTKKKKGVIGWINYDKGTKNPNLKLEVKEDRWSRRKEGSGKQK